MAVNPISPSADARETWRTVNLLIAEVSQLRGQLGTIRAAVESLQRRPLGGGGGMILVGEWQAQTAYDEGNVVVIGSGPNMGTYVALTAVDPSNTPPENGDTWAQLPGLGAGYWI